MPAALGREAMRANRNDRSVRNDMRNGLYHEGHEAPQGVVAVTRHRPGRKRTALPIPQSFPWWAVDFRLKGVVRGLVVAGSFRRAPLFAPPLFCSRWVGIGVLGSTGYCALWVAEQTGRSSSYG